MITIQRWYNVQQRVRPSPVRYGCIKSISIGVVSSAYNNPVSKKGKTKLFSYKKLQNMKRKRQRAGIREHNRSKPPEIPIPWLYYQC